MRTIRRTGARSGPARTSVARSARLAHPFDEDADLEHVTGSAIVVGERGTVLHVHKRLGRWLQPGGHLAAGETPWDAARREAHEETGLAVTHPASGPVLLHVDVHDAARGHTHLDLRYLLLASDAEPSPPPGESPDVRWFAWTTRWPSPTRRSSARCAAPAPVLRWASAPATSALPRPPRGPGTMERGAR